MNCPQVNEQLGLWVTKALTPDVEQAVSEHLLECARCRQELSALREVEAQLMTLEQAVQKADRPMLRVAQAAVLFFVAILVGSQLSHWMAPTIVEPDSPEAMASPLRAVSPATEFTRTEKHTFDLVMGTLYLDVKADEPRVSVTTPLGMVLAQNAQFEVTMKEDDMNARTVFGAAGILTVGVVIGAVVFKDQGGDEYEIGPGQQVEVKQDEETGDAEVAIVPRRKSRDGAREEEMADLIAQLERDKKNLEEQVRIARAAQADMAKKMATEPVAEKSGPGFQERQMTSGRSPKISPREVSDLLGLEAAREEALAQAYDKVQQKIRDFESRLAEVEKTEDGYKIKVPKWEDDWAEVQKDWKRDLGAILLPKEMDKYERHGMQKGLFHSQGGQYDRTIDVEKGDKGYSVSDTYSGNGFQMKSINAGYPTLDDATKNLSHMIDK